MGPATLRELETDAEIDAFYRLAVEAFSDAEDVETAARLYRLSHETGPDFHPGQRRGAVIGSTLVGGYLMLERWLVMGPARIRTACIGSVVTHPEHRQRGIATAMMHDAEAHARYRGHSLLLLNGIPNFYARLGYADIVDLARHAIPRDALPDGHDVPAVRLATLEDAPALLALYRRHYGGYRGGFVRTLEHQRHHLRFQLDRGIAPLVVDGSGGIIEGYLLPGRVPTVHHAREVAADSWPAACALLLGHAALDPSAPELWWPLPHDSPTLYLLADNLRMPNRLHGETLSYPLTAETPIDPHGGWMARAGHLSLLVHQVAPFWGAQWAAHGASGRTAIALLVDDQPFALILDSSSVTVAEEAPSDGPVASFSSAIFTQLLFGYRPVSWAAAQPEGQVPDDLLATLTVLFPPGKAWIPGSDVF